MGGTEREREKKRETETERVLMFLIKSEIRTKAEKLTMQCGTNIRRQLSNTHWLVSALKLA